MNRPLRAAEFFAGIGLMRGGLEAAGIETIWANDIEPRKRELYVANFGEREFILADVRDLKGASVPNVDLATASFPCTDLSLAGNRRGLGDSAAPHGLEGGSSMFWEFARVLEEMGTRRPQIVLLENVLGFQSSRGGKDILDTIRELNRLGYSCDLLSVDARHFVPQSRPRMFIVGLSDPPRAWVADVSQRPAWVQRFARTPPGIRMHTAPLPPLPESTTTLRDIVERFDSGSPEWWEADRVDLFVRSLSTLQAARLNTLRRARTLKWRTAYRRTRNGVAVWEIRADELAGCLRTARGGSSRQALVEAGRGGLRIRWLMPREYARLMGAENFTIVGGRNQALFGFGDAVCVPVISWLARHSVLAVGETRDRSSMLAA